MKLKIDSFYHDSNYGVLKYRGIKDGKLLFEMFEKSFETSGPRAGWLHTGQRVNLDPSFHEKRIKAGRFRPILPPQ